MSLVTQPRNYLPPLHLSRTQPPPHTRRLPSESSPLSPIHRPASAPSPLSFSSSSSPSFVIGETFRLLLNNEGQCNQRVRAACTAGCQKWVSGAGRVGEPLFFFFLLLFFSIVSDWITQWWNSFVTFFSLRRLVKRALRPGWNSKASSSQPHKSWFCLAEWH